MNVELAVTMVADRSAGEGTIGGMAGMDGNNRRYRV